MTNIPIGYTRNYRARHHPVTALLTLEEFNEFATLAARSGMKTSQFLTKIARLYVEQAHIEATVSDISRPKDILDCL